MYIYICTLVFTIDHIHRSCSKYTPYTTTEELKLKLSGPFPQVISEDSPQICLSMAMIVIKDPQSN